jgi:hypothetical protein
VIAQQKELDALRNALEATQVHYYLKASYTSS